MKILSRSHLSLLNTRKNATNRRVTGVLASTVEHPDAGKRCRTTCVSAI